MSTYEDDHNIPEDTRPNSTNPADPSPYAARDAPRTFEGFMQELQRIIGAARFGDSQNGQQEVDGGGLMVDEDLYDEIFGNLEALGGDVKGASPDFIKSLPRVTNDEIAASASSDDDEQNQSCPICMLSYAQIVTEQEYAEASDYHIGGNVEEMGLRRLPCEGADGGTVGGGKAGHIVCGKCAAKWLRLNNTCPLCRATMDPSVSREEQTAEAQANYTDPMLQLFRSVFGHTSETGVPVGQAAGRQEEGDLNRFGLHTQARGPRPNEDDEFNSMYS